MHCLYCETIIDTEINAFRLGESELFLCLPCYEKFQKPKTMEKEIKSYEVKLFKTFILSRLRFLWVWTVYADNGEMIGKSSQGYVNKDDAEYNIRSLGLSLFNSQTNQKTKR